MAIVRSSKRARVSKPHLNFSPETIGEISPSDDSDGSDLSGCDSGMESDGRDDSYGEASETGAESVKLGNRSFSMPLELYDLNDLSFIFSVSNWNEMLSEEERFYLAKFLPDMDRENLSKTLAELFSGKNFHFGSPLVDFFRKLKGGEFEPQVNLYRQGLSSFQKRQHYHHIRKYHNSMITGLHQIKYAWENCKGYGIQERLRFLNVMRSKRDFANETNGDSGTRTDREDEHFRRKKIKLDREILEGRPMGPVVGFGKPAYKIGNLGHDVWQNGDAYGVRNGSCRTTMAKPSLSKSQKKQKLLKEYDEYGDGNCAEFLDLPGRKSIANEVTIASYAYDPPDNLKRSKYIGKDWMSSTRIRSDHQMPKEAQVACSGGNLLHQYPVSSKTSNLRGELGTHKQLSWDSVQGRYRAISEHDNSVHLYPQNIPRTLEGKKVKSKAYRSQVMEREYWSGGGNPGIDKSEETESDSSDHNEEGGDINSWAKNSVHSKSTTGRHESRTGRSPYDPATVNQISGEVGNPYILGLGSAVNIHALEGESYMRQGKPKAYSRERRQEDAVHHVRSSLRRNYVHDYTNTHKEEFQDNLDVAANLSNSRARPGDTYYDKESYMPLLGCTTVAKRRIEKADEVYQEPYESVYQQFNHKKIDNHDVRKRRKIEAAAGLSTDVTLDMNISRKRMLENELEIRPQKKTFTLITPTIHTGFSFSIIHLLSTIRKAMITFDVEDVTDGSSHPRKNDAKREAQNNAFENGTKSSLSPKNQDTSASEHTGQSCFPSLTVQEIVNRVQSNPGDPCILETQEPLQDLVRGVLKILSSKTAPLGAKGWRALVSYEKSNKGWSWVGPICTSSSDNDIPEEEISPEAWGIPHKMLVNLVNAFANWLKSSQDTLKQIGSLPPPPVTILANLDEKERFRDLRTQKNPATINPSSDEQRAYFRKEEFLRYSIPDRAFSYTAYDGKKSSVAPLRRGAGKPTSKARDHYILKIDRPPHVTILCIVRDAAARLPGSIGTRADICTLLRDSQYIVEDVAPTQVNQVVSGALDRLHYELDPCIHFDNDRKLWVYLHSDRQEEDFEDDGTASTKNWKRSKKDATEHDDMEAVNDVSYHGNEDASEIVSSSLFDLNYNLNVDS